ncbi:putative neural-cadherin 2 isoform X1 [Cherax quadricarinatus]
MNVRVTVEDKSNIEDKGEDEVLGSVSLSSNTTPLHKPSSAASLASMALPLQVIDTNSTSLVTPRLMRAHDCHANKYYEDYTCTPASCLNGGRCLKTDVGNRCVCPGGSLGPRCKVVTRTFFGSGWAWLPPLSPCLPATISLRLLTTRPHALILYSGPLATTSNHPRYAPTPMLALQLVDGRPQVLVEGGRGPVKLIVNATLNTGTWHTLHLHLTHQGVMLIVDLCGHGWSADTTSDGHCSARAPWVDPQVIENWSGGVPLQVGGLAHPYPYPEHFGWTNAIVNQALDGCISRLTLNGEVVDVGEPAHSSGSIKGCMPQEKACGQELTFCGIRGSCAGGLIAPRCDCEPGWSGFQCSSPTVPVSLGKASYMKVALPFSQDPYHIMLQLRVRARGHPHGLLMFLPSTHHSSNLKLELRSGVACASMSGPRQGRQEVCLETFPLGDGAWHTVRVGRHGPNLIIGVDDSDGWRQNGSWESFHSSTLHGGTQDLASVAPVPLTVDTVTMGGLPEFVGTTLAKVNHDLQQCCVDDVRVMDHPIALTHDGNTSEWDQSNRHHNLHQGCVAPDVCVNTTCLPPLSCHHPWRETACSCGPGEELVGAGCHDVDECVYQPCLHGGSCINLAPGYHCVCGPAHVGHNCEWTSLTPEPQPLASPLLIVALTLFLLLVVVLGVVVNLRLYRCRATRSKAGVPATPVSVQAASDTCPRTAVEEEVLLETIKVKMPSKHIFSSQGTNHMMPLQGPGSLDDEAVTIKEMSLMIPERVARMTARDEQSEKMANQRRRSIAGVTDVDIHEGIEHKVCLPPTLRSAASHTLPCFTSVCTSTFPTAAFYSSACSTVASSPSVCSAAPCPALYSAVACHNSECATGCPVLVCSKACPASTEFKTNSPEQCPTTLCSTTAYPPASCSIPVCSTAMCPTTSHHTISSKTKCPREISSITESRERVGLRSCSVSSPRPLLAQDDLRAYAYEGEDSVGITPVAELKSFSPRIEKKSLAQFSVNKCTSNV